MPQYRMATMNPLDVNMDLFMTIGAPDDALFAIDAIYANDNDKAGGGVAAVNTAAMSYSNKPKLTFLDIPVEIRLQIYRFAFLGSQLSITPERVSKKKDPKLNGGCVRTDHYKLLLTCRAIFQEAYPVYWQETSVTCADGPNTRKTDGLYYLKLFADRLPIAAKRNIRHLRDIRLPASPNMDRLQKRAQVKRLRAFLDRFPKLESLGLPNVHRHSHHNTDDLAYQWTDTCREELKTAVLECSPILEMAQSRKFSVLVRQSWTITLDEADEDGDRLICKITFENLTTGKLYHAINSWPDDENKEGFYRALEKVEDEEVDAGQ